MHSNAMHTKGCVFKRIEHVLRNFIDIRWIRVWIPNYEMDFIAKSHQLLCKLIASMQEVAIRCCGYN
jgi:hypothetical protein